MSVISATMNNSSTTNIANDEEKIIFISDFDKENAFVLKLKEPDSIGVPYIYKQYMSSGKINCIFYHRKMSLVELLDALKNQIFETYKEEKLKYQMALQAEEEKKIILRQEAIEQEKLAQKIRDAEIRRIQKIKIETISKILLELCNKATTELDPFNHETMDLTEREFNIIIMRGLGETLLKIGGIYGVQRETVRKIEHKAWRKLRHPARTIQLREIMIRFPKYFACKHSFFQPEDVSSLIEYKA